MTPTVRLPVPPQESNGQPPPPPGWWYVAWHWVRRRIDSRRREQTASEARLLDEVLTLRRHLHDRDVEVFNLKTQVALDESEITVLKKQIQLMAEVHEVDRSRVAADLAAYVRSAAVDNILVQTQQR